MCANNKAHKQSFQHLHKTAEGIRTMLDGAGNNGPLVHGGLAYGLLALLGTVLGDWATSRRKLTEQDLQGAHRVLSVTLEYWRAGAVVVQRMLLGTLLVSKFFLQVGPLC